MLILLIDEYRRKANLPEIQEDSIKIIKSMRSSSPPPSSTDMMNAQKRGTRQKRVSIFFLCLTLIVIYLFKYTFN